MTESEGLEVVFYRGVRVERMEALVADRQLDKCRANGCAPNVRFKQDEKVKSIRHIYFEHDDWCSMVGGTGQ